MRCPAGLRRAWRASASESEARVSCGSPNRYSSIFYARCPEPLRNLAQHERRSVLRLYLLLKIREILKHTLRFFLDVLIFISLGQRGERLTHAAVVLH